MVGGIRNVLVSRSIMYRTVYSYGEMLRNGGQWFANAPFVSSSREGQRGNWRLPLPELYGPGNRFLPHICHTRDRCFSHNPISFMSDS